MSADLLGLPKTHHVALDVTEVGGITHLTNILTTQHLHATQCLDPGQGLIDVIDTDRDHRPVGGTVSLEHAAADIARLGGTAVFASRPSLYDGIAQLRIVIEAPPEGLFVELVRPLLVIEGDLKMYDATVPGSSLAGLTDRLASSRSTSSLKAASWATWTPERMHA